MRRKKLNTIKAYEEPIQLCGAKNIVNEIEKNHVCCGKKCIFAPKLIKVNLILRK